jgi:hypothetical protein
LVKLKRLSNKKRRAGIRKQLQFLRRSLGHIEEMLTEYPHGTLLPLPNWLLRRYWVLPHLYHQQYEMYKTNTRRCNDRIVSISQPYIRPIIRGKQGKTAEFGAKISVSLTGEGLAHVDKLHWNAQHEDHDLKDQVEAYQQRYGLHVERSKRELSNGGGQEPFDALLMFNAILLGQWHSLSDAALEQALCVWIDFLHFRGLSLSDAIPDETTLCRFRNRLVINDRLAGLLASINEQIQSHGLMVKGMTGAVIDATLIESAARPFKKQN